MAYHEFGIMQTPPQNSKRYDKYEPDKYNCISINDEYIDNILEKLSELDLYWHTLDVSGKGIANCGITLIPPTQMQKFILLIENTFELCELKELLSKAYNENKWIIHFGV